VSADTWRILGEAYYFSHRYSQAIAQLQKTVELDPQYWFPHMGLGRAYLQAGRTREAIAELETATRLAPEIPDPLSALGNAYGVAGQKERANASLARLQQLAGQTYVSPYYFTVLYAGLGAKTRALEALAEAYRERSIFMTWLKTDPVLDPLRATRQFQNLYGRVGFDQPHSSF
jgi:tetratricopeptide (TPR) repeat protein